MRDPTAIRLEQEWQRLCSNYLPLAMPDSIWRFNRAATRDEPEQGWKVHVSATVLTAGEALARVAPYLSRHGIQFKAPSSLFEVSRLNSGLQYGYSQIGKVITIYPHSDHQAVAIAKRLHELTRSMIAPAVPFEDPFGESRCIYYRYGSFRQIQTEGADSNIIHAIRSPNGKLVPDIRESVEPPPWIKSPFWQKTTRIVSPRNPIGTRYYAFSALTQRGRGGVYMALDAQSNPPRLCILKEGRRAGEPDWQSRDGCWRVRNEFRILKALTAAKVKVPKVYASFVVDHHQYLVMELIEGESLQAQLLKRRRRFSIKQALALSAKLCNLLADIHAAGWTWRDFKPSNIIVTPKGDLRPIDFEGACRTSKPDRSPWGTEGFTPPHWRRHVKSRRYEDLYALGATLYLLWSGMIPDPRTHRPLKTLRRDVPSAVADLVEKLIGVRSGYKPSLRSMGLMLSNILRPDHLIKADPCVARVL